MLELVKMQPECYPIERHSDVDRKLRDIDLSRLTRCICYKGERDLLTPLRSLDRSEAGICK